MERIITTSWDDGHPKDFRLAELLDKYNLPGTFYIPKTNKENEVMESTSIVELSKSFEIGGHTLNHVRIFDTNPNFLEYEIKGCYDWLSDLIGLNPVSFCFPGGVVKEKAVAATYSYGFRLVRTTELLSTSASFNNHIVPTTMQVFDHSRFAFLKNTLKRHNYGSLGTWLYFSRGSSDLFKLINFYLGRVLEMGGCFHLWGHSWEIEQYNLWSKLEDIFKLISDVDGVSYLENRDLY
ncbi:MAG: polysaccharide deacetylase family protein [Bacteroidetes bacterium]|nr:polysaccharide deacetylase family protein [Bacteroidota bacterium]